LNVEIRHSPTESVLEETQTPSSAPAHDAPPATAGPKVIYVLGAGRSGSTILGVALGNCPGVFFAGELNKWLTQSGMPSLEDAERMRFWGAVREGVADAEGLFGYQTTALERSSALFRVSRWPLRRRLRAGYRRVSEEVYRSIARATGASHIVDTSHYPLRARELQALEGVELHLLYLVRDPQSVVRSLARQDVAERSFGMLTTNAYLWLTNLLSVLVFLRHPRERRLFVRHEDFRADPAGVLAQILEHVGAAGAIPDLSALKTGVPLHGNRLVGAEVVALEASEPAPPRRSWTTTLLQLPWTITFSLMRPAVAISAPVRPPTSPAER
jgi:hypothetical protein